MSSKNWKAVERKHSALFKCTGRVGPTGLDLPDSYNDLLTVESKCTSRPPAFVLDALQQAADNTQRLLRQEIQTGLVGRDRLPLVVIHADGTKFTEDVVAVRLSDFATWIRPALEQYYGIKLTND